MDIKNKFYPLCIHLVGMYCNAMEMPTSGYKSIVRIHMCYERVPINIVYTMYIDYNL